MAKFQEILNFWFGTSDRPHYGKPRDVWFSKNSEFDQQVKTRFLSDYELAASGKLNNCQDNIKSLQDFELRVADKTSIFIFRKQVKIIHFVVVFFFEF